MATVKLKLVLIGNLEGQSANLIHPALPGTAIKFFGGVGTVEMDDTKVKEFQGQWPHGYQYATVEVLEGEARGVQLQNPPADEMLKYKELSERTGVTHKQLQAWTKEGKITPEKRTKGSAEFSFYSLRAIEQLMAEGGEEL